MLQQDFYMRPTEIVARDLLGKFLHYDSPEGVFVGEIVETEAYLSNDPANHAFRGMTKRNAPMFGPAGTIYIYQIYGMHWCFNIVTEKTGVGEAVLIRACRPIKGIEHMRIKRHTDDVQKLCRGPACLVRAFGFSAQMNGHSLISSSLSIRETWNGYTRDQWSVIKSTPRIGITQGADLRLRYCFANDPFVSGPLRLR